MWILYVIAYSIIGIIGVKVDSKLKNPINSALAILLFWPFILVVLGVFYIAIKVSDFDDYLTNLLKKKE